MAGTLGGGARRAHMIAGINVTPMVDVALVLLVILMVASTYIVAQTLKVQLPHAKSSDGTAERPATVTIQKDGKLRFNESEVTETQLSRELLQLATRPEQDLVVSADKEVAHGRVVHVLDIAKLAGIVKFAINVKAE
jgi:biopolymer transport protein ExbD